MAMVGFVVLFAGVASPQAAAVSTADLLASTYALAELNRMVEEDYRADFALDWAL